MADLVIRNGLLVDGTGAPPRRADVAITGERITEVSERIETQGKTEIDADGLAVTPGWIDVHTHYDGQATWDPILAPSATNGVTTIVMGNCGVGFAPARRDRHDWLINLLEGVEDIPGAALAEGLTWDWESFPEYLDALDRRPRTIDVAAQMPHSALRTYVLGDRGADPSEPASPHEVAAMAKLMDDALTAGALGFTTSRTILHRTKAGLPIPTLQAHIDELVGITDPMRARKAGVMQMISDAYLTADAEHAAAELAVLGTLARQTKRPLSFTVQQPNHVPDRWRELFTAISGWNAEGFDVKAQVGVRPIGTLLGHTASLNPFFFTPTYRTIARLPFADRIAALNTGEVRSRILEEHPLHVPPGTPGAFANGFFNMYPLGDPPSYEPDPSTSIAAVAKARGIDVTEYLYDLLMANEGRDLLYCPINNYSYTNLNDVREMMTYEHALFGLSDGGAHCNFICDATMPTTAISHWTRDRKEGRLPIEFIVHGQTQRIARHVGWTDRGAVTVGSLADLNVIDLARLQLRAPRLVADLPAGGTRLMQRAEGYVATLKSGMVTFRDGQHTGALPGHVVRSTHSHP